MSRFLFSFAVPVPGISPQNDASSALFPLQHDQFVIARVGEAGSIGVKFPV